MKTNQISLLTVHLFVSNKNSRDGLEEMLQRLSESGITMKLYGPDDALLDIHPKNPRIYVSLGPEWEEFTTLNELPLYERKRWLHYNNLEDIQSYKLFYCWLNYTDPLSENRTIP